MSMYLKTIPRDYAATEGMLAGSGGSRRGSYDTEPQSDDSSSHSTGGQTTPKGRSPKINVTTPKRKDLMSEWCSDMDLHTDIDFV